LKRANADLQTADGTYRFLGEAAVDRMIGGMLGQGERSGAPDKIKGLL